MIDPMRSAPTFLHRLTPATPSAMSAMLLGLWFLALVVALTAAVAVSIIALPLAALAVAVATGLAVPARQWLTRAVGSRIPPPVAA